LIACEEPHVLRTGCLSSGDVKEPVRQMPAMHGRDMVYAGLTRRAEMEGAMWKCIRCHLLIDFSAVEPGIDSFGIYFICPVCRRRNKLINIGKRGRIALQQTGT
jgi:hypothetical protein